MLQIAPVEEIKNELDVQFEGLLSVLKTEIQVYEELLILLCREKEILLNPSLVKLQENNSKKETMILKARMLEEVRNNTIRKISECLGIDGATLKLSVLADYTDGKLRRELLGCRTVLRGLMSRMGELNAAGRHLLDSSLTAVKSSIDFLGHMMFSGPTYVESGDIDRQKSNGKFLCTEG
jgi:hypothetical protein